MCLKTENITSITSSSTKDFIKTVFNYVLSEYQNSFSEYNLKKPTLLMITHGQKSNYLAVTK